MTTENSTTVIIGGCLYTFVQLSQDYIPLSCHVSELDNYTCAGLNRESQLCGRCKKGFASPVYSYSMQCVPCKSSHLNWMKYIVIAFGPVTLFFLFVTICHNKSHIILLTRIHVLQSCCFIASDNACYISGTQISRC